VTDPAGTIRRWAAGAGVDYVVGRDRTAAAARAFGPAGIASVDPFDNQNTDRYNLILNADLGKAKVTWQTTHLNWSSSRASDLDFTPATLFALNDIEKSVATTQELRVNYEANERFNLIAGAFYYENSWKYARALIGSPNTVGFPLTGRTDSLTRITTKAYSAFASGSFKVTDQITLDAGLRYTHERKEGRFQRAGVGVFGASFPNVAAIMYAPQVTKPLDYNFGVRFEPTSDLLLYATYGRASKSGSYQDAPTTVAGAAFKPERAKSLEAGAKYRLDRGSIVAAVYDTRIHDF
jgi:iron complex outermembrane receptor protein